MIFTRLLKRRFALYYSLSLIAATLSLYPMPFIQLKVVRQMKEKVCYVAEDVRKEEESLEATATKNKLVEVYILV